MLNVWMSGFLMCGAKVVINCRFANEKINNPRVELLHRDFL